MKHHLKTHWKELAIWGGAPTFASPLHVGRPNVGDRNRVLARVSDALDRRWLSNDGPYVKELEAQLAMLCGVPHCVCVSSGTVALELAAVVALADTSRTKVIVPSLTFTATAHAFRWRGLQPQFVDIDPQSLTICPDRVAEHLDDQVAAICGVHLFGQLCDVLALERLARAAGVPLLFDASHALNNAKVFEDQRRVVGQSGLLEAFSLHATKFVGCGEGGAIATKDPTIAEELRRLRKFGYADGMVAGLGTNAKMSELCAAMGLSSLEQIDRFLDANRRNYEAYRETFRQIDGVRLRTCNPATQNCQYVVIEVDSRRATVTRDDLLAVLRAENVLARPYFSPPCHRQPPYSHETPPIRLPHTDEAAAKLIALPTGECVTAQDIRAIGRIIQLAQSRIAKAA